MIITVLAVAVILYLALQFEDKMKIPSPLGLIGLSFGFQALFHNGIHVITNPEQFAELVLLLIPILLIGDAMELKVHDLKAHGLSLFYLAVIAVAISVVVAIPAANLIFAGYHLSTAAIITLFAMVLATDPVSVVSIFSNFQLPHKLKILAEGESLFNDATALIVFVFIGLFALDGGKITFGYVSEISLIVVLGSAILGILVGFIGLILLKTTENRTAELFLIILTGYGAFAAAEHFYSLVNLLGTHSHLHLSGILSCIAATITVHHVMSRSMDQDDKIIEAEEVNIEQESRQAGLSSNLLSHALGNIKATVEEKSRHMRSKEDIQLLAVVANTILFIAMAEIIDLNLLMKYSREILGMFLVTTIIRGAMMAKFAVITNQTTRMTNVSFRWWGVLTFAGIKGGLSIVMLMMIPASFEYLEMFRAVVIGVVLLSTFVYSAILIAIIGSNRQRFIDEKNDERLWSGDL